ncbi:MAG: ComEC/Rec2 family competence protein [Brumimicrobium sp.]|nr:ComEC/Rec2 family competence protein [Brumimicrobium sp.]
MLARNQTFKLLVSFICGVLIAHYLQPAWIIAFTLWAFLLLSSLCLIRFGRKTIFLRKVIGISVLMVFLFSGVLGYSSAISTNMTHHFSKEFLPGDQLIGTVEEFELGKGDYNKMIFHLETVVGDHRSVIAEGKILCYVKKEAGMIPLGSLITVSPELLKIRNKNNPGEFDAETFWKTQGISDMCFLSSDEVKINERGGLLSNFWMDTREYFKLVFKTNLQEKNYGVASALALGDKSSLTKEKRNEFADAGAMHVLAVSGMHVGILLGFLQWIFFRVSFLRRRNLYIYFALIVVWSFAFLTGLSASVFRATLMFSILAVGQLKGYPFFNLNALLFSALILLLIDPFYLFDIGFQLSFAAMLGIIFFYQRVKGLLLIRNKWIDYFWQGTALGIAAQIGTMPLSLYYFHQFPNYFILTNLGLIILSAAALIAAIVLLIFHWIPYLADVVGYITDLIFTVLNGFIEWINTLPFKISSGYDPGLLMVLVIYLAITGLLYFSVRRNIIGFRLMSYLVFILAILLLVDRELNKTSDELVVFNHYEPFVVLKEGEKMLCFYPSNDEGSSDSYQFMVEGYKDKMGSEAEFIEVRNDRAFRIGDFFSLTPGRKGWEIRYFNENLLLLNQNTSGKKLSPNTKVIKGDWFPYADDDKTDLSTQNGAIIFSEN